MTPPPFHTPPPVITPTPLPSPTPTFNPLAVHLTERGIPTSPLYLAAGPDDSAYFGFGANGSGSNLYRLESGSLIQTRPAPPPSGYDSGGGVYGIAATDSGSIFWLSAYSSDSYSLYVDVECGGAGGTARLCEPTVDEPTSMVVDSGGVFWVGGLSYNGGGLIATSTGATLGFQTASVMQLVNGPQGAVWGALADFSTSPAQYSVAEFALAGSSITVVRNFNLPSGYSLNSMTLAGDGALWFGDFQRNAIGRIDAQGTVTEVALRTSNALGSPQYGQWQIATACDGAVWFTEPGPNRIARIDSADKIIEFTVPTAKSILGPIAAPANPIGTCMRPEIWAGEQQTDKLLAVSY